MWFRIGVLHLTVTAKTPPIRNPNLAQNHPPHLTNTKPI